MGQLYNLSRKGESIVGLAIDGLVDMHTIQAWCVGKGYGCNINLTTDGNLSINVISPDGSSMPGVIGSKAVLKNGVQINIVPASQFDGLFDIGSVVT